MWHHLRRSEIGRFTVVGGANTTVHYAVYLALWSLLPQVAANIAASVVATSCSYFLNCRFTFGVAPSLRSSLLFPLSNVAVVALGAGVAAMSVGAFGVDPVFAPLASGLVAVPATFVLNRAVLTGRTPGGDWRAGLCVAGLVAVLCQVPVLVNPSFYFWDDSAAQFLPMWHRLGERLLSGDWPPVLDLGSWMGGNIAAETLFGIWNPVQVVNCAFVVWIGDLAVAAAVVKTEYLVLLGVGTFLLCRVHGAGRAAASAVAVALPVSGFVLYFEAATWAGGLVGFAWLPWAWWALRRVADGVASPLTAWILCFLCVSAGDPYGAVALCFVFAGVLAESRVRGGGRRAARALVLTGVAVAATLPLVYFPLLAASSVSWRSGLELFNVGLLVPRATDLLNASLPSFAPQIRSFGSFRTTVPATYLAWFAVPLLAWVDWRGVGALWRRCGCAAVLAVGYFLWSIGPSNVWLFRWPLRHVAVLHLALAVLLAVVLSRGLRTDHLKVRSACTVGVLLLSGYLAFAAWPAQAGKHLVSLGLVGLLLAVAVRLRSRLVVVLHLGTACALVLQCLWFPANRDVAVYNFPTDVRRLRAQYRDLGDGAVMQVANRDRIPAEQIASGRAWSRLLLGNMPAVAGLESLVSYTGIGFDALHRALCLEYNGSTCPAALARLWRADAPGVRLADELKVTSVVVQRSLVDSPVPPAGWWVAQRTAEATVLRRGAPVPWPRGRLSHARGVLVTEDVPAGRNREVVRFVREAGGDAGLVFARLAWPGYRATVDGRAVPVASTPAGLLVVRIPAGIARGELVVQWWPPGFAFQLSAACAGALLAVFLGWRYRRWVG
ncbi:GtrA family protein [Saccharopolyspora rosea]|uniref:GtrA family protein n=1 Tax=Saccharopolyspora rosea TaxID=524884 RepID=UPI0021DAD438|nr:GtrA family protein [Saccharopolyspora rosea]